METTERLISATLQLVKCIVEQPDLVSLQSRCVETGLYLRLRVAPCDVGKVIGKQGRNAIALRRLLAAAGKTFGICVTLDIDQIEP